MTAYAAVTVASHRGLVRSSSEDAWCVSDWRTGTELTPATSVRSAAEQGLLVAVCDGVGGHPSGERASALACAYLHAASARIHDVDALREELRAAHDALLEDMRRTPQHDGMATTLAVVVVLPDCVLVSNVGDSRVYEIGDGGIVQLSTDDSPERPDFLDDDAPMSVVTQVLGGTIGRGAPRPHDMRLALEDGLAFLLCSDGLTDVVGEEEIEAVLDAAADDTEAVDALVAAALRGGGPDNITAITVRLLGEGR